MTIVAYYKIKGLLVIKKSFSIQNHFGFNEFQQLLPPMTGILGNQNIKNKFPFVRIYLLLILFNL